MSDKTQKPIWGWALAACWIAIFVAVIGVAGTYMEGPQPDGQPGTPMRVITYTLIVAAGAAVMASAIVWAIFYMLVFGRRASVGKALVVLPIMIVTSLCIAAPMRFLAIMGRVSERNEMVEAWAADGGERIARLNIENARRLSEIGDISLGSLHSPDDIGALLERTQRAEAVYAESLSQILQEQSLVRTQLNEISLTDDERTQILAGTEQRAFLPARRYAELSLEAAQRRTAMTARLAATRGRWVIHDGQVLFLDQALLNEMQTMAAEHDRLAADVETRRRALAGEAPLPD